MRSATTYCAVCGLDKIFLNARGLCDDCAFEEQESGRSLVDDRPSGDELRGPAVADQVPQNGQDGNAPAGPAEHCTDLGNARRLVARSGVDIRYSWAEHRWYIWDGRRFARDDRGRIFHFAKRVVKAIYAEAAAAGTEAERKELARHAIASESTRAIRAMVELASSEQAVVVTPPELDADPWLLNVANGTLDLRDCSLREHRRQDLMTRLAPVAYDPDARSELWDEFLERVLPDREVRLFVQRVAGSGLVGIPKDRLIICHGSGANGKSTYTEALRSALGDYAITSDFSSFLAARRDGGSPRSDLARLAGVRLVCSVEMRDGGRLAEGLVKWLTGGDTFVARSLYATEQEFMPGFTLLLASNHKPRASDDDEALWRRILQVPFDVVIPEAERDEAFKERLRDPDLSGPAVLAWAVRGCLAWQTQGFDPPEAVRSATTAYREEMDPLRDFLAECCVFGEPYSVQTGELMEAYKRWCREAGEEAQVSSKELGRRLAKRPELRSARVRRGRGWYGVGLAEQGALEPEAGGEPWTS